MVSCKLKIYATAQCLKQIFTDAASM